MVFFPHPLINDPLCSRWSYSCVPIIDPCYAAETLAGIEQRTKGPATDQNRPKPTNRHSRRILRIPSLTITTATVTAVPLHDSFILLLAHPCCCSASTSSNARPLSSLPCLAAWGDIGFLVSLSLYPPRLSLLSLLSLLSHNSPPIFSSWVIIDHQRDHPFGSRVHDSSLLRSTE